MVAAWLKARLFWLKTLLFLGAAAPGLDLLWRFTGRGLGSNPLEEMTHVTGRTALILLVLTLTITPLRKLLSGPRQLPWLGADWGWLVRLRRPLGLWSFCYALVHGWIYLEFDLAYQWSVLGDEVGEKPFITVGVLAFMLLIPLAATSTTGMIRRLGRYWQPLHRSVYGVALLALLHFWWLLKADSWRAWPETAALVVLLGYRLLT